LKVEVTTTLPVSLTIDAPALAFLEMTACIFVSATVFDDMNRDVIAVQQ
jgi:hypothetical protein